MASISIWLLGLLLFASYTCNTIAASQSSYPSKHYQLTPCGHGVTSTSNIIAQVLVGNKGECAMACTREDSCTSFNIQMPSSAGDQGLWCQLATGDNGNCAQMAPNSHYDNYQVICYQGLYDNYTKSCTCLTGWGGTKCQREKCCNFKADGNTVLLFNFDQMADEELSVGRSVTDESSQGNDGTVNGSGAKIMTDDSACVSGYRITANNGIQITDSPSLSPTTALTIEVWMKPAIVDAGYVIFKTYSYGLKLDGLSTLLLLYSSLGTYKKTPTTYGMSDIMYVAGTFDGSQMKIYLNGVLMKTELNTNPIRDNSYSVKIGQAGFGNNDFDGMIYAIRLSNVARSASEIMKTSQRIGKIWCPRE